MRALSAFLLVLLLTVGSFLPAAGQAAPPTPVPPAQTAPAQRFGYKAPINRAAAASAPAAPAVNLGQPGLNFRYLRSFGTPQSAYLEDTTHINYPYGVAADGSNVWIADSGGKRALKFADTGAFITQIGKAGYQFGYGLGEWLGVINSVDDVAVDSAGNIWLTDSSAHRVVKWDSGGNPVSALGRLWEGGADNDHFDMPVGIAFDSAGNIYVSDGAPWWQWNGGNQRIQVFNSAGTYLNTLGVTGVSGSDNGHFNGPRHIATDGSNYLYVADAGNHRVQVFDVSNPLSPSHIGTLGVSSVPGSDNGHFSWPMGVAVDGSYIYVADTGNNRVQIFNRATYAYVSTIGAGYGSGNTQFDSPCDVAVDSAGNVYVADFENTRVQQFHSSRAFVRIFGATGVPYLTDDFHYNEPRGVAVADDGSIYIVEGSGHRLLKLNAAGSPQWTVGQPGVRGWDNTHFGWPSDVALDPAGRVYVANTVANRIDVYNPAGTYYAQIGSGSYGTGNDEMAGPRSVAIGPNSLVYVADTDNQRVQIFSSNYTYVATLGVTGVGGSDNAHFATPEGVAVDGDGNIYVSDRENNRVQVFSASRLYVRTVGVTGVSSNEFGYLMCPGHLAVDRQDRLYVTDGCPHVVDVFDRNGAFLTRFGGWGDGIGRMDGLSGVAVDRDGNMYVSESVNHRIQKFAPGVPGWRQTNINGFGDVNNQAAHRMSVLNGRLYASTENWTTGGEVWRTANGIDWTQVNTDGFGNAQSVTVRIGDAFNGQLYAGVQNDTGGEIWRCSLCDGSDWTRVVAGGFGDADNTSIERLVVYGGRLYATTSNGTTGAEIWRSPSGDPDTWTQVNANGFGDENNRGVWAVATHNGSFYAVAAQWGATSTGIEVWRCALCDGSDWTQVNVDGFGNRNNMFPWAEAFSGKLYVGSVNYDLGAQVWRCTTCDGSDWATVTANGFGDPTNQSVDFMIAHEDRFYLALGNSSTGTELWRTGDGEHWSQVNLDGFGDSNNEAIWSGAILGGKLFFGTVNWANGAEVWQLMSSLYLPLIQR